MCAKVGEYADMSVDIGARCAAVLAVCVGRTLSAVVVVGIRFAVAQCAQWTRCWAAGIGDGEWGTRGANGGLLIAVGSVNSRRRR